MRTYLTPVSCIRADEAVLEPWPLQPGTILDGAPEAFGTVISRSDDNKLSRGIWRCSPGRFRWVFGYDETVFVIQGRATIEFDTTEVFELTAGVVAFFGRGHQSIWTIHETLLKVFHADEVSYPQIDQG